MWKKSRPQAHFAMLCHSSVFRGSKPLFSGTSPMRKESHLQARFAFGKPGLSFRSDKPPFHECRRYGRNLAHAPSSVTSCIPTPTATIRLYERFR